MTELKDLTYKDFITNFAFDSDDIKYLMMIEYQGFDPNVTFNYLLKRADFLKVSKAQFAKDMQKVVLYYVKRGTRFDRTGTESRTKTTVIPVIQKLMDDYTIMPNLNNDLAPERISIARVVIVFSEVASAAYNSKIAKPIFSDEALPLGFSFPSSPSLMTELEWITLKEPYLRNMVKFTKIINRRKRLPKPVQGSNTNVQPVVPEESDDYIRTLQETFAENSRNSVFSTQNREFKRIAVDKLSGLYANLWSTTTEKVSFSIDPTKVRLMKNWLDK